MLFHLVQAVRHAQREGLRKTGDQEFVLAVVRFGTVLVIVTLVTIGNQLVLYHAAMVYLVIRSIKRVNIAFVNRQDVPRVNMVPLQVALHVKLVVTNLNRILNKMLATSVHLGNIKMERDHIHAKAVYLVSTKVQMLKVVVNPVQPVNIKIHITENHAKYVL